MIPFLAMDQAIIEFDKALKTVFDVQTVTSDRSVPGSELDEAELSVESKANSLGLMRVNHAGEVSAQALYQGQALTAKLDNVREGMEKAALEENDHLVWCKQRVEALGGHTSALNPIWYGASFALGAIAGQVGDKWSLGFVVETEKQVVNHLDEHLLKIDKGDVKSRAVLQQMREDELHHGTVAHQAGAAELPEPVKQLMSLVSKVMTATSYRI